VGIGVLRKLAAGAPARVFAVAGIGERDRVQDLKLERRLELVETPRAANVLLVFGRVRSELVGPLVAVHDHVARPRRTVLYRPNDELRAAFPGAVVVETDVVEAVASAHRDVVTGASASEAALLPDVDPAPWRGVGPYGQGGSGMTGGTPYGRPLADRADDRDGLTLDQLPLRIGPFASPLPPGLVLDVKLQGDVFQSAAPPDEWWSAAGTTPPLNSRLDLWHRALFESASIGQLEVARARHHVRWVASALDLCGLPALSLKVLDLASRLGPGDAGDIRRLARSITRTGALAWHAGVGVIDADAVDGLGVGPTGRAAGVADDARLDDDGYERLGFQPVVHSGGDVSDRWRQRLDEAAQSLELAALARGSSTEPIGRIESPRGRLDVGASPSERLLRLALPRLAGLEWGDAVMTMASVDVDVDEIFDARFTLATIDT
jgi:hypothetical protein